MEYTKCYNELRSVFDPDKAVINIPGCKTRIFNLKFQSDLSFSNFSNQNDRNIAENNNFSYPLFVPEKTDTKKVILLFHGLNERSWVKYLAWAYYLSMGTGSYVILFPISFHINRSPDSWKDPRAMFNSLFDRKLKLGEVDMSSFANVALSDRLTDDPLRFFSAGYQTARDIIKLIQEIKKGEHQIIPAGSRINIFAYSIGAFLAEILLMSNAGNLFSESKLFMFCGGSVFSNMKGTSKLIMDKIAFEKVYNYYLNDFEKSIKVKSTLSDFFHLDQLGLVFRSMIDIDRFRTFREEILRKLKGQIYSISLMKDTVIPAAGILATLSTWNNEMRNVAEIKDFPYQYTHENPFPVLDSPACKQVDNCFYKIFSAAQAYLD